MGISAQAKAPVPRWPTLPARKRMPRNNLPKRPATDLPIASVQMIRCGLRPFGREAQSPKFKVKQCVTRRMLRRPSRVKCARGWFSRAFRGQRRSENVARRGLPTNGVAMAGERGSPAGVARGWPGRTSVHFCKLQLDGGVAERARVTQAVKGGNGRWKKNCAAAGPRVRGALSVPVAEARIPDMMRFRLRFMAVCERQDVALRGAPKAAKISRAARNRFKAESANSLQGKDFRCHGDSRGSAQLAPAGVQGVWKIVRGSECRAPGR